MKAFVVFALVVAFVSCATAQATISYLATAQGDSLYLKPSALGTTFDLTAGCDGTTADCTTSSWTSTPDIFAGSNPVGTTAGVTSTTAGQTLTIHLDALGGLNRFVLTFTATPTTQARKLVVFLTDGTIYESFPSVAGAWKATLVDDFPRNKQLPPAQDVTDFTGFPTSFTTGTVNVPLYWGNYYEVRIGLTNAGTFDADTEGSYCGTTGVWPGTDGDANDVDNAPATPKNSEGCDTYLEQGDIWTFPAPKQRVTAYNTLANQAGNNNYFDGPLTFNVRNGTASSLVFTGRPLDSAAWLASCVPAALQPTSTTPADFPCILPRYNPDPQVWVITANKPQPTRFTGITTSTVTTPVVTPRYQATPKILFADLDSTNDFKVLFEWADLPAVTATATNPGQTATTVADVPSCSATSFAGRDPAILTTTVGVDRFVTCDQGLQTSVGCTASATVTNCLTAAEALTAGASFGTTLQTGVLESVYIAQRPLALRTPAGDVALNSGNGGIDAATWTATVGGRSGAFTVGFPQESYPGGALIDVNNWNSVANDTVLTITPRFVYECATGGVSTCIPPVTGAALPEYLAGSLANFFGSSVPTLNISRSTPVATFTFTNLPFPTAEGATWRMYFDVKDAVTRATPAGYSWSNMPRLDITVNPIEATFVNFPPDDGQIFITQPQTNNGYLYELHIEKSAAELGVTEIRIAFTLPTSDPVVFFVGGSAINSGGAGAFVFTGTQKVIHFQIIATAEVTSPFSITFTDPAIAFFTNPDDLTGLTVVKNPINVKLPDSTAGGPYVREEFQIEFTWSPPATSAFTITIRSDGLEQGTVDVQVNVGDTGAISPNLTAKVTQAATVSSASFSVAVQFTTSSAVYSLPTVALLDVYRHSLVVTNVNNDASSLTLYTTGQKSREYCISTNYPVFTSAFTLDTDSLIINFAAVDDEEKNVPGVIADPTASSFGGPNFLVLNKTNNGHGCVTLRADRLFNWDSLGLPAAPGSWDFDFNTYLGGSLANMFQEKAAFNFPSEVTVQRLMINFIPPTSSFSSDEFTFVLGETVTVFAYVDVLPPVGLTYQLKALPVVTITPSSANLTGAADIGGQWHAWDVTFDTPLAGGAYAGLDGSGPLAVAFSLYVAGPDATFYRSTDPSPAVGEVATIYTAQVVKRTVEITIPTDDGTPSIELGDSFEAVQIALNHPVVNSLTVKLVAHNTNGVDSVGLTFDPASVTFTPSSPNSALITVTGNLLGEYSFGYELSGPDAEWFSVDVSPYDDWNLLNVTQRTAAGLPSTTSIYAGVTYGPFAISFNSPLGVGESVTISPFGSDFTFTPANFTLLPGQTQAPFSFVFKPQSQVSKAYIFWRVSGPSAWKYRLPSGGRQEFTVSYLSAEIVLQGSDAVIPGVAHEGYVSLPFPASISVTPAIAGGAAITFNPASFDFTPATGNVIHFTYTVSATQVFGLASANVPVTTGLAKRDPSGDFTPDTTGTSFTVPFLFSGTDAALFDVGTAVFGVSVIRPQFLLDATYSDDGVVINSVEQDSTLFVIGKWSQKYSIHLASPPAAGSVTLTITDTKNIVEFEFGSGSSLTTGTTATLTFTADNYLQHFRFRFVNLLSEDLSQYGVEHLSVTVSQPFYDYTAIFGAFDGIVVVPALAFSPIPAIYTDGSSQGLFAAVKQSSGAIASSWPYADDAQFTLHIVPSGFTEAVETVVVEPSTLEFSKSSFSDLVQGFTIRHTNPRNFDKIRSYKLKYYVRFAGSSAWVEITNIVPQDAQNVLLSRYQVIPKFPHVLSYGWQKASFNISFTPVAHISFIPRLPPVDGDYDTRGARAAGRVDFEPAVIVAAPGQQVVNFKVKAQPGVDRDQLYYRVDWEVIGHKDDLVNLVESLQVGAQGLDNNDNIHFATWHLASAGVTTISFALIAVACVIAVARNMF